MKNKRKNKAVSDIIATMLLLGMAIALFSIVQVLAFSLPYNPNPASVRLVGNVEGDYIYIAHHGGEPLPLETKLVFTINNNNVIRTTVGGADIDIIDSSSGDPNLWEISEKVKFDPGCDLSNIPIDIVVIDSQTNSIIMQSTIQE